MDPKILIYIFDLTDFSENEVADCIDVLLINQLSFASNKILYLSNCYDRSINYGDPYINIVYKYFNMYVTGELDSDHTIEFCDWIANNKFDYWNLIFNKKNFEMNYYHYINIFNKLNNCNAKYYNIKKILSLEYFINVLTSSKKTKNGIEEQSHGPFSWFIEKPFKTNINDIYDTLQPIFNNNNLLNNFFNKVDHILKLNKAFTFSDLQQLDIKKTSSTTFIFVIFKILLKLFNSNSSKELNYDEQFPRNDFKLFKSDCNYTKLYILTCRAFHICYNSQLIIYNNLRQKVKNLSNKLSSTSQQNNFSYYRALEEKLQELTTKFDLIEKIILDKEYQDDIDQFLNSCIDKNIYIGDEFTDSIIMSSIRKFSFLNNYDTTEKIKNYYLEIINGSICNNPHIRYNAMIYILDIIDVKGFMGMHVNVLTKIFKYFSEVNFYDYYSHDAVHNHLLNLMSNISKICMLMDKNDIPKYQEEYNIVFKGIHKMSSKIVDYLENISDNIKFLKNSPTLLSQPHLVLKSSGKFMTDTLIRITTVLNTLNDVIHNIISDADQLTIELVMPINILIIQIFKFFSDGSSPIYAIYKKNMEGLDIMQMTFNIVNAIKENKIFKREIYEYVNVINEVLPRTKLDPQIKITLENYFYNFEKVEDYIDHNIVPDDFLDPILCTLIRDPIMIPHVDLIFDKSSILSQLYHENINPYTRETLTLESVENFNKLDNVIEKVNTFKYKFDLWKQNNIK